MAPVNAPREVVRFGVFELDLGAHELRKHGRRVRLQDKPFQVLALLVERAGTVVTREELRARLWPGDTFVVFDDNVNAAIKKVRDALGDIADSARFIETVPRRGYKFIAPLAVHAPSPPVVTEVGSGAAEATRPPPAEIPRARRLQWGIAAGLVLAGAIAGAALVVWWRPAAGPAPVRVRQLTLSGFDSEPAASPDGKSIAFTSRRDGVPRIWWKLVGGGGEEPRTNGPDRRPRFFPDGLSLLFLRSEGAIESAWRVPVVGGAPQLVIRDVVEAEPSPDGSRIAFARLGVSGSERVTELGTSDIEGNHERVLTRFSGRELVSLRWSPAGTTLAAVSRAVVSGGTALVFVDVDSGSVREVPANGVSGAYGALSFVGDGTRIVATASENPQVYVPSALGRILTYDTRTGRQEVQLYLPYLFGLFRSLDANSRVDVLDRERLVYHSVEVRQTLREVDLGEPARDPPAPFATFGNAQDRQPVYSPDGSRIVFASNRSGNLDLWTISRTDGEPRQLTDGLAPDRDPAFTPDGRSVLWSSTRTGHLEVWASALDGSNPHQVSQDGADAQNPTMGRAGWIVYASANPAKDKAGIWRVKLDGTEAARIVAGAGDRPLTVPDVSPSGRYALYRQDDRLRGQATIRVVDVIAAAAVPFEIVVPYRIEDRAINILWGRARWTPDERAIVFVGQDPGGRAGLHVQDFAPGHDTGPTRRQIVASLPRSATESFGIAPDGAHMVVSDAFSSQSLMLVDGLQGIDPPRPAGR